MGQVIKRGFFDSGEGFKVCFQWFCCIRTCTYVPVLRLILKRHRTLDSSGSVIYLNIYCHRRKLKGGGGKTRTPSLLNLYRVRTCTCVILAYH